MRGADPGRKQISPRNRRSEDLRSCRGTSARLPIVGYFAITTASMSIAVFTGYEPQFFRRQRPVNRLQHGQSLPHACPQDHIIGGGHSRIGYDFIGSVVLSALHSPGTLPVSAVRTGFFEERGAAAVARPAYCLALKNARMSSIIRIPVR